jgi:hypothetical protein
VEFLGPPVNVGEVSAAGPPSAGHEDRGVQKCLVPCTSVEREDDERHEMKESFDPLDETKDPPTIGG